MSNKEYAEEMRKAADNWMDIMPVTKKLWLQIADRIEASPEPAEVRPKVQPVTITTKVQPNERQVVITTAGSEESWFRRLFFQHFEKEEPKELPAFDWGDLT